MTVFGMKNMPVDHRGHRAFRIGGGLIGLGLLIFGVSGLFGGLAFFHTEGERVAGLSTNAVLSTISVVVGAALIVGALIGGNTAASLNCIVGALFLISGFANMCVLRTSWNVLNFSMSNVIFSFVVGIVLLAFGFYGAVSTRRASERGPDREPGRERDPGRDSREAADRQGTSGPG